MKKKRKVSGYDPPIRCRDKKCKSILDLVHLENYRWCVKCPKCRRYEGRVIEDEPHNHVHYVGGTG